MSENENESDFVEVRGRASEKELVMMYLILFLRVLFLPLIRELGRIELFDEIHFSEDNTKETQQTTTAKRKRTRVLT